MERAAPLIRNGFIVRITGGGHFLFRDAPEAFVQQIDAFLSEP